MKISLFYWFRLFFQLKKIEIGSIVFFCFLKNRFFFLVEKFNSIRLHRVFLSLEVLSQRNGSVISNLVPNDEDSVSIQSFDSLKHSFFVHRKGTLEIKSTSVCERDYLKLNLEDSELNKQTRK